MQKLVDGIHQFQVILPHKDLIERIANGQQPLVLFIACSDFRNVASWNSKTMDNLDLSHPIGAER
jgi:carbonic anhydrase